MKNSYNNLITILALLLISICPASAQDDFTGQLQFEVNKVYPYISITKEELQEALTVGDLKNETNDLNFEFKPSWVERYIFVDISTRQNGQTKNAQSLNDTFTPQQKALMQTADKDSDISIKIKYIPKNTLSDNTPKEIEFSFTVAPTSEAEFPGGTQQLNAYLKENAIDKIPADTYNGYDLTIIKFTVNKEGTIINAHLFGNEYPTSTDEKISQLLLKTVQDMPCWQPATYSDGTPAEQEFALLVGNTENCSVHLLNIR